MGIVKKCTIITLIFMIIFNIIGNLCVVKADGDPIGDIVSDGDSFIGQAGESPIDDSKLKTFSDSIYNILLGIGMVIAVIIGSFLGIKFMISSIEEKAKIKETLIAYVIGCMVLFGAFGIWKMIINMLGTV